MERKVKNESLTKEELLEIGNFLKWIHISLSRLERLFEVCIEKTVQRDNLFGVSGISSRKMKMCEKMNQVDAVQCHECLRSLFQHDSDKKKSILVRIKRWLKGKNFKYCSIKTLNTSSSSCDNLSQIPIHNVECESILSFRKEFFKRLTSISCIGKLDNDLSDFVHLRKIPRQKNKSIKKSNHKISGKSSK